MQLQRFSEVRKLLRAENGSAVLEFVGFGLILQILLLMMAVGLAEVQQTQFAAEAIARHSLRSYVLMDTPILQAATEILDDFAVKAEPRLLMTCRPIGQCEASGALITLEVFLGKSEAVSVMRQP
jgi:hypothetical protein